jgi:predicted HicB family RNase H-like nuclease
MAPKAGRGSDQFVLRLPEGMRERIKADADANNRSMNAEIVSRLEGIERREAEGAISVWLPPDLLGRIIDRAEKEQMDANLLIVEALEQAYPAFSIDWLFEKYVTPAQSTTSEKEADRLAAEANALLQRYRPELSVQIFRQKGKPRIVSFGNASREKLAEHIHKMWDD